MKIKKKYAIRKLAIGVASVSIGLFVANSVDNQFGNNISLLKNNSGVVHAACNSYEGVFYALNHYDYETVYEGDSSLPKGEHKDYRAGEEGRQIFSFGLSRCNYFPEYAFGDNDEIEYKPYEVITDKRKNLKAYESYKNEHNLNEKDYDKITEKEKKNIEELWDNLFPNKNEIFFYETRTKKKIIFDESISEPVYKEDGTVIYPKTKVSKTHKNYYGEFLETTMNEENSLDNISVLDRTSKTSFTTVNLVELNKQPKEAVSKIIKVGNVERTPISTTVIETEYVANNNLDYGIRNTTNQGKEGLRENVVTYEVDRNTGNLKNPTTVENTIPMEKKIVEVGTKAKVVYSKKGNDVIKTTTTYELNTTTGKVTPHENEEVIKVGEVKDKVEVENIESPIRYEKDNTREKGKENITVKGKDGSKTTTTTYTVNPKTGEVEAHSQKPVIVEPTETVIKVAAKDKVEIVNKKDGSVVKETTTYTVNEKTGEITESKTEETLKSKTETSKGTENPPVVESLPEFTGVASSIDTPVVEKLTELKVTIIKDNKGNILDVIKENETPKDIQGYKNTGKTEIDKDGYKVYIYEKTEENSKGSELPPIVENKDFVGGVNSSDTLVVENLPELKVAVIKDNKDNILDVIKEDEKPKDIQGYKNTGKTETDKDGRKVYIYEKVEDKQESPVDKKEETEKPKTEEKVVNKDKEDKKEAISKKEELPKTSASMLSTVGLFSIFGLRKNRRKDKK